MVVDVVVDVARELLLVRRGNVAGTRPGDLSTRYFITGTCVTGLRGLSVRQAVKELVLEPHLV